MLHISKEWPTPTGSVHPGMLPSLLTVTPYTPHHVPASTCISHPGQPFIDLSYNKDDDDSSDDCDSTIESMYNEARSTQDPVLPIHQDLSNVYVKDDECVGSLPGSFTV